MSENNICKIKPACETESTCSSEHLVVLQSEKGGVACSLPFIHTVLNGLDDTDSRGQSIITQLYSILLLLL